MHFEVTMSTRSVSARALVPPLVIASVLAISFAELAAQSLRVLPSIGVYVPISDLGELSGGGLDGAVELGRTRSTVAVGLAGEVGSRERTFGLRAGLMYGTSAEVPIGGVGCTSCSARSTLLVAAAALAVRPIPRLIAVQPYLLLGGGIKRYDFDTRNFREEGLGSVLDDQTHGAVQVGLGADFGLGQLSLFSELNAYFSRVDPVADDSEFQSESDLQTDLTLSVGLSFGG